QMGAACDQYHLGPRLAEPGGVEAADAAGAHDCDAHSPASRANRPALPRMGGPTMALIMTAKARGAGADRNPAPGWRSPRNQPRAASCARRVSQAVAATTSSAPSAVCNLGTSARIQA